MDVFIADDSDVVRDRLATMLADMDGVRIAGEAGDIPAAVEGVTKLRPHAVILDVELPGGTGIDVLKAIAGLHPKPRVIMLTNTPQPAYREQCQRAGADFFFDKTLEFEKVAQVLRVWRSTAAPSSPPPPRSVITEQPPAPQAAVVQQRAAMVDSSLSEDVALLAKQISGANSARIRPCSTDTPWYTNSAPAEKTKESLLYAALCAQTLRDSDMLVISDVSRDPRSRGSVLSSGGGPMRFFAGVPLILFDGLRFGTLTICDRKPRELTTEQRRALLALSRQTVACLELRRREAEADAAGASLSARPVTRDLLTGLQNRAALHESVLRGIAHATRHAEKLAFLYVDLDNFRGVNESYGRPVGDAFLVETGKRLLASVRGSDTVARLGGDEFAVLINGLHSADDAMHVAQKLIRSLSLPFDANGRRWSASCSIGVSVFPLDGGDGESLLRHADTAMYRAKSAGKGGYALFTANGSRH